MTVTLTSTGSPKIGCASITDTAIWTTGSISSASSSIFPETMQVNCVMIAQTSDTNTGVTIGATLTVPSVNSNSYGMILELTKSVLIIASMLVLIS